MKNNRLFAMAALAALASAPLVAQPTAVAVTKPQTFATPQKAAEAFVAAAQKEDKAALAAILGVDPKLLTTGNLAVDDAEMQSFAAKAQEKMTIEPDPVDGDRVHVLIGCADTAHGVADGLLHASAGLLDERRGQPVP